MPSAAPFLFQPWTRPLHSREFGNGKWPEVPGAREWDITYNNFSSLLSKTSLQKASIIYDAFCLQDETEVERAVEQMLAAAATLTSVCQSTPLPPAAINRLSDVCRQIEMLTSARWTKHQQFVDSCSVYLWQKSCISVSCFYHIVLTPGNSNWSLRVSNICGKWN